MLQTPYITLIFVWIIFAIIHRGLASGVVMRRAAFLGKYYRPVYSILVLAVLLVLIHFHFTAIDTILFLPHWIEKIIAGILILGGLAVMVISLWNNLLPMSGIATLLGNAPVDAFEQKGLHAYVRHPMYTGVLFFLWGVFLGYPYMNNLVTATCFTAYAFMAIYFLEKKLIAAYGTAYQQYQMKVPRLLPVKGRVE